MYNGVIGLTSWLRVLYATSIEGCSGEVSLHQVACHLSFHLASLQTLGDTGCHPEPIRCAQGDSQHPPSMEVKYARLVRSFAALRMTASTALKPAHGKSYLQMPGFTPWSRTPAAREQDAHRPPENVLSSRKIIEVVVEEVVWVGWQCLHATLDRR